MDDLRTRILRMVEYYPGLHLREIQRRCGCSPMLAEYHLNVLERLELVTSATEGRYRNFFPKHHDALALDRTDKRWLAMLRRPPILAITLLLMEEGGLRPMEIADRLGLASSTASYQIRVAKDAGLVVATTIDGADKIRLADGARILAILQAYHPTPDALTEYASLWSRVLDRPAPAPAPDVARDEDQDLPAAVARLPRAARAVYRALQDGPLTQKELCLTTGHARRTVYGALKRLDEAGLLTSHPYLLDTRQHRFMLKDESGTQDSEDKS